MDPRLQALIDRFEIIDVLNAYCHGCDRLDEDRIAAAYHADSWDDHGSIKCSGPDFARTMVARLPTTSQSCTHQLGQSIVHIDGDNAGAETYFIATRRRIAEDGEILDQMGGRYVDDFERRGGAWKIKNRLCVREWSISLPVGDDWLAGESFAEGRRSAADPSYRALRFAAPIEPSIAAPDDPASGRRSWSAG